jgi:hypothetical protein
VSAGAAIGFAASLGVFVLEISSISVGFAQPDRLVRIWRQPRLDPTPVRWLVTGADVYAWRRNTSVFQDVAAIESCTMDIRACPIVMRPNGSARRVRAARSSPNLFQLLGVQPQIGTLNIQPSSWKGASAVLSAAYWREEFGSDPGVIGTALTIAFPLQPPSTFVVAGVLAESFEFSVPDDVQVWLPTQWPEFVANTRALRFEVIARLAPAVDASAAARRLLSGRELEATGTSAAGDTGAGAASVRVESIEAYFGRQSRPVAVAIGALASLVGVMVALAVGAVAALELTERRHDWALRAALGARQAQLIASLAALLLKRAVFILALGTVIALGGYAALVLMAPAAAGIEATGVPLLRLLMIELLLVAGAQLAAVPSAWAVCRPTAAIGAASNPSGRSSVRLRVAVGLLAAASSAILITLIVVGTALLRTWAEPTGVTVNDVAAVQLSLADHAGSPFELYESLVAEVPRTTGVTHAALVSEVPFGARDPTWMLDGSGGMPSDGPKQAISVRHVSPEVFETLGLEFVRGRGFTSMDRFGAPQVAVLSARAADALFGTDQAIGRKLRLNVRDSVEIIGIASDARLQRLTGAPTNVIYLPLLQKPALFVWLLVDSEGHVPLEAIRGAVEPLVSPGAVLQSMWLIALVDRQLGALRFISATFALGAVAATSLFALGLVATVGHAVTLVRSEVLTIMALGANRRHLALFSTRQFVVPLVIGLAGGCALAAWMIGLIQATVALDAELSSRDFALGVLMAVGSTLLAAAWSTRLVLRSTMAQGGVNK